MTHSEPEQVTKLSVILKVVGLYLLAFGAVISLAIAIPLFLISLLPGSGVEVSRWFPDGVVFAVVSFLVALHLVGASQDALGCWSAQATWLSQLVLLIEVSLEALTILIVAGAFEEISLSPLSAFTIAVLGNGLMELGTGLIELWGRSYLQKRTK